MSFVYGAILWGSVAAAAPVIIHLLMRSKARKVTLPTLRFVKTTHRANYAKLKLKHLILLAMRMAAIVLAVLLLARVFLPGHRSPGGGASVPLAMVVVVDNSASMGRSRPPWEGPCKCSAAWTSLAGRCWLFRT